MNCVKCKISEGVMKIFCSCCKAGNNRTFWILCVECYKMWDHNKKFEFIKIPIVKQHIEELHTPIDIV